MCTAAPPPGSWAPTSFHTLERTKCYSRRQRERRKEAATARKPACRKRQTQTGRECKERAAGRGSVVPWGQGKSQAIGPQQLLSPKEYTLTLHLMGMAIGGHLPPVQGGLRPRLCHQRGAEIGCDSRLGPEAVSTGQATGDHRAPSRVHHSLQTRGSSCPIGRLLCVSWLGWNRGLPSTGSKSIRGAAKWCLNPPNLLLRPTTSCLISFKPLPHTWSALLTTLSFQTSAEA